MAAIRKLEVGTPYNPYKTDRIFALVPGWLMERREITPGGKLCYAQLRQHAGKDGQCWPKTETLARGIGVSERSVIRYVQELEKFNLIRSIRRGQGRSNEYIFLTHIWMYQDQEPDLSEPSEAPDPEVSQAEQNHRDQTGQIVISRNDNLSLHTFKRKQEKKTATEPVAAVPSGDEISQAADLIPDSVTVTEGIRKIIRHNIARHGTDYVIRNIRYTNAHIRDKGKYRAYLDKCLRGDWGIDFTEPEPPAVTVPPEPEIIRELAEAGRKAEEQRAEGERQAEIFLALPEDEQERIRAGFLNTANAFTRRRTGRMDNSQLARNLSFQGFLAEVIKTGAERLKPDTE